MLYLYNMIKDTHEIIVIYPLNKYKSKGNTVYSKYPTTMSLSNFSLVSLEVWIGPFF